MERKGNCSKIAISNLLTEVKGVYDQFYVQRVASSEHRLKELKLGIKADRLSCQKFIVNQFRLFLSQAAYILMLTIRKAAQGTRLAQAQVISLLSKSVKTLPFLNSETLV